METGYLVGRYVSVHLQLLHVTLEGSGMKGEKAFMLSAALFISSGRSEQTLPVVEDAPWPSWLFPDTGQAPSLVSLHGATYLWAQ